jgi:hypothetical protein
MPWKHVSLAACLGQVSLSLFLWSTGHRGSRDTWQHRSSPLRKAEPRAVEHVAASELPSQEGRAWSPGTRGSAGAHLSKEARSRATKHVAAPELTSARRRGSELRNTWRRRSSPQQGGEVWGHGTHGGSGAHFYREVWFEATTYVAARGYASCSLSWLRACMWGYPVFRVPTVLIEWWCGLCVYQENWHKWVVVQWRKVTWHEVIFLNFYNYFFMEKDDVV